MYRDLNRVKIFLNSDLSALTQNEGQGQYRYPKNYGKAEYCNLYVYVNIETGATIESDGANAELDAHVGWTKIIKQGLKDKCPNKGDGCNPYSCQEVPY